MSDSSSGEQHWLSSVGLIFGLGVGVLLAGGGLLASRPELVLVAAPILASVVWAFQRRPRGNAPVRVTTQIGARTASEFLDYTVSFELPDATDAVILRLYERGRAKSELVVSAQTAQKLSGQIGIVHSGPQELVRVDYSLVGPQSGVVTAPTPGPRTRRVIPPRILSLRRLPLPFRMFGLSGGHDSARPGDGGEFRDIGQFAPGDRLRRIDWRVTARRAQAPGDLYVRHSFATADATVLVVMDSRDDIADLIVNKTGGPRRETVTSLDLAREAAASIAKGYANQGDRIGFRDLAGSTRAFAPGGGTAHLQRMLSGIARARPIGSPLRRLRPPVIPAGALVYVLSTFLDSEAARMAELWRVSGHRVVAVDVLPVTPRAGLRREQEAALRMVLLERESRILELASLGVDVIRWRGISSESPESQLARRSRGARRPR